jgi:hypothetical protein
VSFGVFQLGSAHTPLKRQEHIEHQESAAREREAGRDAHRSSANMHSRRMAQSCSHAVLACSAAAAAVALSSSATGATTAAERA